MNTLIYDRCLNSVTNELAKPTPSLRLCLAICMEGAGNIFTGYRHTRKTSVSSLGSLGFSLESRDLFFHPGV